MLLRFGASPTLDNGTDGNSPLHVLAVTKKPDMKVCFLIYTAAGAVGKSVTNKEGLTAYSVRTSKYNFITLLCCFLMFVSPAWVLYVGVAVCAGECHMCSCRILPFAVDVDVVDSPRATWLYVLLE